MDSKRGQPPVSPVEQALTEFFTKLSAQNPLNPLSSYRSNVKYPEAFPNEGGYLAYLVLRPIAEIETAAENGMIVAQRILAFRYSSLAESNRNNAQYTHLLNQSLKWWCIAAFNKCPAALLNLAIHFSQQSGIKTKKQTILLFNEAKNYIENARAESDRVELQDDLEAVRLNIVKGLIGAAGHETNKGSVLEKICLEIAANLGCAWAAFLLSDLSWAEERDFDEVVRLSKLALFLSNTDLCRRNQVRAFAHYNLVAVLKKTGRISKHYLEHLFKLADLRKFEVYKNESKITPAMKLKLSIQLTNIHNELASYYCLFEFLWVHAMPIRLANGMVISTFEAVISLNHEAYPNPEAEQDHKRSQSDVSREGVYSLEQKKEKFTEQAQSQQLPFSGWKEVIPKGGHLKGHVLYHYSLPASQKELAFEVSVSFSAVGFSSRVFTVKDKAVIAVDLTQSNPFSELLSVHQVHGYRGLFFDDALAALKENKPYEDQSATPQEKRQIAFLQHLQKVASEKQTAIDQYWENLSNQERINFLSEFHQSLQPETSDACVADSKSSVAAMATVSGSPIHASGDAHKQLLKELNKYREVGTESFFKSIEQRNYSQALRRACTSQSEKATEMIRILISFKERLSIDISHKNKNGDTAADFAFKNNKASYDLLIKNGVDKSHYDVNIKHINH